jgi:uncharacterized protein YecE (DUF72 family)
MEQRKNTGQIYIGTSGWMYKDWGKTFYPKDMKSGFLEYLASEFNTVEINSSFYHLPLKSTFKKWYDETPSQFIFSTKLSRFITHQKKLVGVRVPLGRFMKNAKGLNDKLGVILIQLPPFLQFNEKILREFIISLNTIMKRNKLKLRLALEPRHRSWLDNSAKVVEILQNKKIALVFPHSAKIPSFPPVDKNITSDFIYIRFHGPSEFAASEYGKKGLLPWVKRIKKWHSKGLDVFVYFNNDINGHAIKDARVLKELLA